MRKHSWIVDAPDVVEVVFVDLSEAVVISVTADFPETIDGIDDIVVPKKTGDVKFAYAPGQFRMCLSLPDILVEASEAFEIPETPDTAETADAAWDDCTDDCCDCWKCLFEKFKIN